MAPASTIKSTTHDKDSSLLAILTRVATNLDKFLIINVVYIKSFPLNPITNILLYGNMRINLSLSPNRQPVPFDYQQYLVGAFHKWLGENSQHDALSLYSLSWLPQGRVNEQRTGLRFGQGASWFVSCYDSKLLLKVIRGIQSDPTIAFGMDVCSLTIQKPPVFGTEERFVVASPVFIKRSVDGNVEHVLYDHPKADVFLTETLRRKLRQANLSDEHVQVQFDRTYANPQTKLVTYNGIRNRASLCPVIISGTPEQLAFAWSVGVGNSTGIGFGSLR